MSFYVGTPFADTCVGGATRFGKLRILQSVNNRTQCLRESAYYAWLLLTYIVINTILGRLTLDPAGMHCPSWDDAFVSSLLLNPDLRSDSNCIYLTFDVNF